MAGTESSPRGRGSMLWLQGLVCGGVLAFAAPTFLLLVVLLAPALASLAVDTDPSRGMTRAVAVAGVAGALSPLWHLWLAHDRLDVALAFITDPLTLTLAWGGGACAWALSQVLPVLLQSVWTMREGLRARAIEAELQRLKEEWHVD